MTGETAPAGTVVNCIDGRVQLPVREWMMTTRGLEMVYAITEAGADGLLALASDERVRYLRENVGLTVKGRGARLVAIAGHHDCAANPGSRAEHEAHLAKAVERVKSWNLGVSVVGLWISEDWRVVPAGGRESS